MNIATIIIIAVAVFLVGIIFSMGYVKAAPNKALIISGVSKNPRVLIGHAGFKIPFFERKDTLVMKVITIDIKTGTYIPTKDFIGVNIDAVAKIMVDDSKDGLQLAMRNFLNMSEDEIIASLTDSLQGNMREIIGTVELKNLCTDRKQFGDEVQAKAQPDMKALGMKIISCNIQSMTDEKNLINELGQDNMSQIKKNASIAKAQAERDVNITEAQTKKEANEAIIASDTAIAQRNNQLAITQSELKKEADTKRAEADAAYEIQKEQQRKQIEVAKTEADIAKQEKEIELQQMIAKVKEQELAATVRKTADADKYRRQQDAEAALIERQKEAEAERYEKEKAAEALRISAEAMKFEAEQQAEAIRAKGLAEAEAIKAKGLAEAEATEKKAEAMAKMKDAAILEMYFKVLPDVAKNIATPLSNIDKITMYGEGNTSKLVGDITKSVSQVSEGLTESLGFDVKSLISSATGGKRTSIATEIGADAETHTGMDTTDGKNGGETDFTEVNP